MIEKLQELVRTYDLIELQSMLCLEAIVLNQNEKVCNGIVYLLEDESDFRLSKFKIDILSYIEKLDKKLYRHLINSDVELNRYLINLLPSKI